MGEDETNVEETVMLTRRERRRGAAAPDAGAAAGTDGPDGAASPDAADPPNAAEPSDDADAPDEATLVVDRASAPPRSASESADDATVVVARDASRARQAGSGSGVEQSGADDASAPAIATAPDAVATPALYKPRPAPLSPAAPPVITGGAAPTRVDDAERTSVVKQGRRWSVYALVAVLAACVVSVAGLIGVGFVVFG